MATSEQHHDEELIIARLHSGEERAFTDIYNRYHQRLYFFAQRFVDDADAKDIVSESFVQLWHKRMDFTAIAAIGRFLFVTVRNRCLNLVRNQIVQQHRDAEILRLLETSEEEASSGLYNSVHNSLRLSFLEKGYICSVMQ